jgi:hypothetical protein
MNRLFLAVSAMLIAAFGVAQGTELFVIPKSDKVGVYKNEIRKVFETPLFRVSTNDRLTVITTHRDHYLVRDAEGRQGWIEKPSCIAVSKSKNITFDSAIVNASWGLYGPTVIPGKPESPEEPLLLDRSFALEMRSNEDKESVERRTR